MDRGCSNWVVCKELVTSHVQQLIFYGKLMLLLELVMSELPVAWVQ